MRNTIDCGGRRTLPSFLAAQKKSGRAGERKRGGRRGEEAVSADERRENVNALDDVSDANELFLLGLAVGRLAVRLAEDLFCRGKVSDAKSEGGDEEAGKTVFPCVKTRERSVRRRNDPCGDAQLTLTVKTMTAMNDAAPKNRPNEAWAHGDMSVASPMSGVFCHVGARVVTAVTLVTRPRSRAERAGGEDGMVSSQRFRTIRLTRFDNVMLFKEAANDLES